MNNDKQPEEKECPFRQDGRLCGDWCPLFTQLMRNMNGMISKQNMCAFVATNEILSDMNMKVGQPQHPRPQIHLPGNLRGN